MNKTVNTLKVGTESKKKNKTERNQETKNLGTCTEPRRQILPTEFKRWKRGSLVLNMVIEEMGILVKENIKSKKKKFMAQNIQAIWGTMGRPNIRKIETVEGEKTQVKITKENLLILKKEMLIKV